MPRYSSAAWRAYRPDVQRAAPVPAAGAGDCLILGLDPGSRRTGYGVLRLRGGEALHVAHGVIDVQGPVRANAGLALRLRRIYEAVNELVAAHRPAEIAIE